MSQVITFKRYVEKHEEGQYLSLPFPVPENVALMEVAYSYDRCSSIIDFGLSSGADGFCGWSGSARDSIVLSEWCESPGFAPISIAAGTWHILLGAYKIPDKGVEVSYTITLELKKRTLLLGDTHLHSTGSDGSLSIDELVLFAQKQGLDYLFITDHNNYAHNQKLFSTKQLTLIPGVEWTHYKGHAGMLGSTRPFLDFIANSLEETCLLLKNAREEGALVVLNHPFCPNCGWQWGMDEVPFDLVELWNGSLMIEANLNCLEWWDQALKSGKHIAVIGGSDFHAFTPGRMPALPCTCVYSLSRGKKDILGALQSGNSFITLSPDGPMIKTGEDEPTFGDSILGGTILTFSLWNLNPGDIVCLISRTETELIPYEEAVEMYHLEKKLPHSGYFRIEVRRKLLPEFEALPIMITNPFYLIG